MSEYDLIIRQTKFHSLTTEQKSGMLGPTINMAQGDPSKAVVFLERRVRTSKHNHKHFLKSHRRIHKFVTLKDAGL